MTSAKTSAKSELHTIPRHSLSQVPEFPFPSRLGSRQAGFELYPTHFQVPFGETEFDIILLTESFKN